MSSSIRRFLFWMQYDGCRFPEMARGGTGFGVMDLLYQSASDILYGPRPARGVADSPLRFSPSSRTDAGVHAVRNAVIGQIPLEYAEKLVTPRERSDFLDKCNALFSTSLPGSMTLLDVHPVSAGFCVRRNVSYRRYTYRLAVAKDWDLWQSIRENPSVACFSERNYAWILPPGFSSEKLSDAARLFEGEQVMGSFFKHPLREKRQQSDCPSAVKNLWHVGISAGDFYSLPNDIFDYYNVTIVAKSFVREQIRRMMSCLVYHAYDRLPLSTITWLLQNPISSNFFDLKIPISPPNGLFLTDVVYDPEMFTNPSPYHLHSWDYDLPPADRKPDD